MLVLLFLCVSLSWGTVVESYCEYYTRYYWHHVPKTAILFILVFVFFVFGKHLPAKATISAGAEQSDVWLYRCYWRIGV
ncbi:hypothetical protein BS47DRAFT_1351048 [Hydnum rufescens UP504]|uniref:Uncharacterized protein n=1 Tax=Hydnum rufescens UP504 TaxID=1448309 RepID=A0A9P6AL42_9AGAM|nr:hypothetical protein BS47DRAFT_1351048 [Hydnum rufescens UP504]